MTVRMARVTDSNEIARLSLQLGYKVLESDVLIRLEKLLLNDDNAVFVMEINNNEIFGWVHVHGRHLIESHSFAEIGGLVVDNNHRRKGIGENLMRKCEEWSREKGYQEVRLRSGGQRKDAHEFYKRIGYKILSGKKFFL
jgi:N-acetylglutamate synthase-like GNAT family acetyltransferase